EVFDEHGRLMPTAEFICHFSLNCSPSQHNKLFPNGQRRLNDRVLVMTQGQTELLFPNGFALPVASDEQWNVGFQAANRTTDQHRRVIQRATFYFIKDRDLVNPVTALTFRYPVVDVLADGNAAELKNMEHTAFPGCAEHAQGVIAPNSGGRSTW